MGLYQIYMLAGMVLGVLLLLAGCLIRKRWKKGCAVLTVAGFFLILAGLVVSLLIQTGIIQEPMWSFMVITQK